MGRQVVKSCPSVAIMMGDMSGAYYSWILFFLGWWRLLFNQEWWDRIWYGELGSPIFCRWGEHVMSIFFGL
jgi:hypothetical protein